MQHLGRSFNDLPTLPPHASLGGGGGSGVASTGTEGGSAAAAIPMDQGAGSDSKGNADNFIVQANLSARQGAASRKQSLEADVTASVSGIVPKRPRRTCTLRSGKSSPEVSPCNLKVSLF